MAVSSVKSVMLTGILPIKTTAGVSVAFAVIIFIRTFSGRTIIADAIAVFINILIAAAAVIITQAMAAIADGAVISVIL